MKLILTVVGKDKVGIIASVSAKLAELDINILDVNQTIMHKYFTMTMAIEFNQINVSLEELEKILKATGRMLKVDIHLYKSEIPDVIHRI